MSPEMQSTLIMLMNAIIIALQIWTKRGVNNVASEVNPGIHDLMRTKQTVAYLKGKEEGGKNGNGHNSPPIP